MSTLPSWRFTTAAPPSARLISPLKTMYVAALLVGVSTGVVVSPDAVEAQDATAAQSADSEDSFRTLLRAALAEFGAGNFEEARGLMTKAHRLKPSARTLRGLGMIEFELRNYAASADHLGRALTSTERPLTDAQRGEVEALLARARGFVAEVTVVLEPASARLLVDGIPVEAGSRVVSLEVGDHIIEARAPGYASEKRQLKVAGGESPTVSLVLQALGQTVAEGRDGGTATVPLSAEPSHQASDGRPGPLPWVVVGVSGAVAVTGAVLLGVAQGDVQAVEGASDGTRWSEVSDAHDRAPTLSTMGGVMLGVGLAGAAVGLMWRFGVFGGGEREGDTAWLVGPGLVAISHRL